MTELAALPRYEVYKDSGVEWLGEIPEHWEITRLGTRFEHRKTKVSDKDYLPLSVTKKGIMPQLETAAKTNDGDNRKLVKEGDFVINSRSDRKGSSGISDRDGSVSLINIVLQPIGIHPLYCHFLLKSYAFVEEFYRKEQQIELLKERRQILIQNAVPRGLDPQAPVRDSGVEWVGEIPAHWETQRFKYLFTQSRLPVRKGDGVVTSY